MKFRSHCPVNFALDHFGDKWSLLIIRDLMFKGKRHYNEFFESEEKVSTTVLRDRLRSLEESGLVSKKEDEVKKSRIKYSLTEKGISLLPVMTELILWSGDFDKETEAGQEFLVQAKENREAFLAELAEKLKADHLSA